MSYKIMRNYQSADFDTEVIATGLTLEQAQKHCHDPETISTTCKKPENVARTERCGVWFDGYDEDYGRSHPPVVEENVK